MTNPSGSDGFSDSTHANDLQTNRSLAHMPTHSLAQPYSGKSNLFWVLPLVQWNLNLNTLPIPENLDSISGPFFMNHHAYKNT